ncbi:MAG: 6-carboxytetrahydropterin synthase [Flavobacteriales bacterium]|nr:6-carboxytetrahydropterin synthase [Flavobacteriales bacterium]
MTRAPTFGLPYQDNALVHITRRERFSAAHKLARPEWSVEQNLATFGKCSNPNWHGHNYELWVTVKGEPSPETGFVVDLSMVSRIINERVIHKLDHKNIDLDVDFMKGRLSSTENLAIAIWEQLTEPIAALGCSLHCIKVQETENNSVEYHGER